MSTEQINIRIDADMVSALERVARWERAPGGGGLKRAGQQGDSSGPRERAERRDGRDGGCGEPQR